MNKITKIKDFLSSEECSRLINFINNEINSESDLFYLISDDGGGNRFVSQFGPDNFWSRSRPTTDSLYKISSEINKIFNKITTAAKDFFNDDGEVYVTSMWLAKQFPGSEILEHEDTDGGNNIHFKYSSIIYLNDIHDGGELVLPDLDFSYTPMRGDAVMFLSQDTGKHYVTKVNEERYTIALWMTDDYIWAIDN